MLTKWPPSKLDLLQSLRLEAFVNLFIWFHAGRVTPQCRHGGWFMIQGERPIRQSQLLFLSFNESAFPHPCVKTNKMLQNLQNLQIIKELYLWVYQSVLWLWGASLHWDMSKATVSKEFRIPCFWLILVLKAHNITNLFVLYIFVVWLMEGILQKVPSLRVMSDHDNLRSWVSICLIRPRTVCQVNSSSIAMKNRSQVSDPWYESHFCDRGCSLHTYASGQVGGWRVHWN